MKMRKYCAILVLTLWAGLTAFAWFGQRKEISDSERRPLAQMPEIHLESVLQGSFMEEFEEYSLDQFPLRDGFRTLKALFHAHVLGQKDNNGIYIADGYAAQLDYPFREASADYAVGKFNEIYETYLKDSGSKILFAVVPDKGYYLAQDNGYPAMDYEAMFAALQEGLPWAAFVELTEDLGAEDYYRTDTHWRQERLLDVAQTLCEALGTAEPVESEFTPVAVEKPFYGVYYGQAALPMAPDKLIWMESELLKDCRVYNYETGKYGSVYDSEKLAGNDLYETFLSGPVSLLTIENPHAETDRELIIFRDSFGSSIAPLLVQGYKSVTLVDVRYISSAMLDRFIDFQGQDVLFLYSTLVLNNSNQMQ